jgi:hypothetical protein
MNRPLFQRLVQAWLLTATIDGLFSSVLSVAFYNSTVSRLFQGVAATLLGPSAINGGPRATTIGILMHIGVALGWSTVFLLLAISSRRLRDVLASPYGPLKVAAVYGPFIWMVMSLVIIPSLLHHPTTFTIRWWVQFFGHIPFVALPIVWSISRAFPRSAPATPLRA